MKSLKQSINFDFQKDGKRILIICLAAILMATNIKTFVRTGDLFPGGATGLTLLIQKSAEQFFSLHLPYTVINIILNAIPVYIGFRFIGFKFTLYSCLMIMLTNILTDIIPGYVITYDILLISIFGGIINGIVISLCLRMNATTGGTDFIAIYFSEKKGRDSFNISLGINMVILGLAGILFGWDKALYSIIFQYTSTQVLHMLYKKYQQQTLFIVTNKPKEVCHAISKVSNHGATILEGEGSYEHCERNVVYSVVSRAESKQVIRAVQEVDPKAFLNAIRTEKLSGQFYQRPNE
ncbi:MAG: YitT family protein [Lachnospiraceae bacterium]